MVTCPQNRLTVFDLEFTAWEGSMARRWLGPGEFTEVVQIGAVQLDGATFEELDCFETLVKPRLNPVLSDYLTKLTGIANEDMAARGIDFADAYRRFAAFAGRDGRIVAFGRDDLVLEANLRLYGIKDGPSLPAYTNVVPWLMAQGYDLRGKHACDVAQAVGADFSGRGHNALDDARSVAAGIRALAARGAPGI
jgi:inhibitor of KinA sporulation pathway (predicted exonuclease)